MSAITPDPVAESALFDVEQPPPVSLADKFGVPPMSVLDRRSGIWRERQSRWLSLGIKSELGRDAAACGITQPGRNDFLSRILREGDGIGALRADGTSVFDPVLCELVYRWHTAPGDRVLDPFAGGSVRGVVASTLSRYYTGIDLRVEQIAANREQASLGSELRPNWLVGDATDLVSVLGDEDGDYDLIFSCPPYADLERYSNDPRDLSCMTYADFVAAQAEAVRQATTRLRPDRFAAWVISDVRDKAGAYRGLVADAIAAFRDAGLRHHNDCVLLDPIGAAAVRAERPFRTSRKVARVHQHLLIFVKGDAKRATARLAAETAGAA